jgi:hypothetical protein
VNYRATYIPSQKRWEAKSTLRRFDPPSLQPLSSRWEAGSIPVGPTNPVYRPVPQPAQAIGCKDQCLFFFMRSDDRVSSSLDLKFSFTIYRIYLSSSILDIGVPA